MERFTIAEAAHHWHISQDTVRRRIRRGELKAQQQPTPQGFVWVVEVQETPELAEPSLGASPGEGHVMRELVATVQVMRELVGAIQVQAATQREELKARRREVQELHVLLHQLQARALPPPGRSWWRRLWTRTAMA